MTKRRGLLLEPQEKPDKQIMEKRGVVAYLMAKSKQYSRYPFISLSAWIDPPLQTNQLAIFYRWNDGEPVGYMTWALLAPDVEHRWKTDPNVMLHFSEWNEGEALWITDFLALPGYCEDIIEFVDQNMFAGHSHASFLRRRPDNSIRKMGNWKRRHGRPAADHDAAI
jgi:cytolysin-activating lysine-acyltransferase